MPTGKVKPKIRVKILKDKKGRYVILKKKKYRIGEKVSIPEIKKWVMDKLQINITNVIPTVKRKPRAKVQKKQEPKIIYTKPYVTDEEKFKIFREKEKDEEKKREEQTEKTKYKSYLERRDKMIAEENELKMRMRENRIKNDADINLLFDRNEAFRDPEFKNPNYKEEKKRIDKNLREVLKNEIREEDKRKRRETERQLREEEKRFEEQQRRLMENKNIQEHTEDEKKLEDKKEQEKNIEEQTEDEKKKFIEGSGKFDPVKGLSNLQIDEIMKKYPNYIDTISHDEIKTKILPKILPKSKGCFIINTDPKSKGGQHWQAVLFDASYGGSKSIEFFDSYGDEIDPGLQRDLKAIAEKLDANTYLKLKENKIKLQNDRSSNCGFFCVQFLIDRLRGKPFREASGFDESIKGENEIEKFKTQHGYGFKMFSYIPSFGGLSELDDRSKLEKLMFPANNLGSQSRSVYERYKNSLVLKVEVMREPVSSLVEKFINFISLGKYNEAKRNLNYDRMFHLYMIVYTDTGTLRIEKNQKVTISEISNISSIKGEKMQTSYKNKLTLEQFLNNGIKSMGEFKFYQYNAFTNNCQDFVFNVLRANGGMNSKLHEFIKQDAVQIVKQLPSWVPKIAQGVTDFRAKLEEFIGFGKE